MSKSTVTEPRMIGIRHRIKKTVEGEARPTQVTFKNAKGKYISYDLEDEQAELDFVFEKFATKFRDCQPTDDIAKIPQHHVKWRKLKSDEDTGDQYVLTVEKERYVATKVASEFDGLRAGDTILSTLGGSGDLFAFALSRQAEKLGQDTRVMRVPPSVLKAYREAQKKEKDEDSALLIDLFALQPERFHEVTADTRRQIQLNVNYRDWTEVQAQRKACQQRLHQRKIGQIFIESETYPEGSIQKQADEVIANDIILENLTKEEARRLKAMSKTLEQMPYYTQVLQTVEGIGPSLAARILTAVGDIRRFDYKAQFVSFVGLKTRPDGSFLRRKSGEVANWHNDARLALYLFAGDQCVRRKNSVWGMKLLEYKRKMRAQHPMVEVYVEKMVDGDKVKEVVGTYAPDAERPEELKKAGMKTRYTNGHIHKMAVWRTATKFAQWLFKSLWNLHGPSPEYRRQITLNIVKGLGSLTGDLATLPAAVEVSRDEALQAPPAL